MDDKQALKEIRRLLRKLDSARYEENRLTMTNDSDELPRAEFVDFAEKVDAVLKAAGVE